MKTTGSHDVPVLVAGAGPAGLATAITLARQGIEVLVVDRRTKRSGHPRATVISTRSMELLRAWDMEQQVRAAGVDVEWRMWLCETLAQASGGSPLPVGYPSREEAALISPAGPACVAQDHLEPLLMDHLRALDCARIQLGTQVTSVDNTPDGAKALLMDRSGRSHEIHARYLVAADGAHSLIRGALGIGMHGPDHLLAGVTALFRAPLWDLLGAHRYGIYAVTHPEASGVFIPAGPAGPGERWLYGGVRWNWDPVRDQPPRFSQNELRRLIRLGSGVADLDPQFEWIGPFSSAAQMASCFRLDSSFLVGDAAHRVTPRGGTGMNMAFQDGCDLGWKLAWVLRGWADPALLDSYEDERRPVAEHNAARSADPNGSVRDPAEELFADLGGRIRHRWVPTASGRVSTLDLLGPGLTLFTGPESARWERAAALLPSRPPVAVRTLDALVARSVGFDPGGGLLARPDGVPAGLLQPGTDAELLLREAVASFFNRADRGASVAAGERDVA